MYLVTFYFCFFMDKVIFVFICPHIFFENTKTVPSCDLLKSEFTEKQKTLTEFFMWDCFCWALKQTVNLNVQMFVVMLFLYLTSCVSCTDLRWQQPAALSLSLCFLFSVRCVSAAAARHSLCCWQKVGGWKDAEFLTSSRQTWSLSEQLWAPCSFSLCSPPVSF